MRVSVLGCGYLGAVHVVTMTELGHEVIGIDVDQLSYASTAEEAAEGAEAVLVLTEWRQYRELDPVALGRVVAEKRVLDARNALDGRTWAAAGWSYRAFGRPSQGDPTAPRRP
jgi:UDP-glucose 6-dehydrogenase